MDDNKVTLVIAGRPLTFCMPPRVASPKPGPCPGAKRAAKGAANVAKAVVGRKKAVANQAAAAKAEREKVAKQLMIRMAAGEKFEADPEVVQDMLPMMDGAPPMNLALMGVKGAKNQNLFDKPLRDIPRDQMPALPDNVAGLLPFIQELGRMGVKAELVELDPRDIRSVQTELSAPKVAKMAGFMKSGWKPGGAMVVSQENALGDGHHRWAGAAMAALMHEQGVPGYSPVKVTALKVDMPIDDLLQVMERFSGPKKSITEAP